MPNNPRYAVFPILILYLWVAGLYAIYTPAWQSPDEPAHYNYVRQMAANELPVIAAGDWDSASLDAMKAARFAPGMLTRLSAMEYEDHQPPLYYMLLTPFYQASGGNLIVLRLISVLMGAGVVYMAYLTALRAFPGRVAMAIAAAAFVAFVPQHVHILASVNNDALALLLVAMILYFCIDYADGGQTPLWRIGLLYGFAIATKTTAYMMAAPILLALLIRAASRQAKTDSETSRPAWLQAIIVFGFSAAPFALLWWGRNVSVYGFPDLFGLRAHDGVVVGQLRTADYLAQVGSAAYWETAIRTTLTSFFGMFGWMAAPLPDWALLGFLALTGLGLCTFVVFKAWRGAARGTWPLFGVTAGLAIAMLIYYNTQFVQFQGRYMFAMLIPLGVTVALGLDGLRAQLPVIKAWPWVLPVALTVSMVALDVWLLARVIIPQLAPIFSYGLP